MQLLGAVFALCIYITYFFRWVLICLIVLIVMINGGFLAGLGAGVLIWILLKFLYYTIFIFIGYRFVISR